MSTYRTIVMRFGGESSALDLCLGLIRGACSATHHEAPEKEAEQYLAHLDGWKIALKQGVHQLQKTYTFNDYIQAMTFTNRIGELAEAHQHHPAILTEWGKVTVYWWTHSLKGLHLNDFIMAAKTDALT